MNRNAKTIARQSSRKTILLSAVVWLAATAPSLAQSYDPDLGAGNTAPPGITYGGGLPEGSRYGAGSYALDRSIWSHRPEFRHHRPRHLRHRLPR
jgi:hypothetical protein